MKNSKILFVGDINVDLVFGGLEQPVQADKEILAGSFMRTMGSTAVITAVVYRFLGGTADVSGLAGDDENGAYMLSMLDNYGIGRDLVAVDKKTPTGVTVNLIRGTTRSQVTYPGTISKFSGPELTEALAGYRHIHFSGIYQQKAFLPNIVAAMEYVKSLGVPVSLDTQWDSSEKWEYLDMLYPYLDYLFINKNEAFSITGQKSLSGVQDYFGDKKICTLVKLGPEGCLVITDRTGTKIPSYPAEVVDTTGAGDAFAGGFLYGFYNKNMSVEKAACYGSAAAARNCEFTGGVEARSSDSDIQLKLKEGKNV